MKRQRVSRLYGKRPCEPFSDFGRDIRTRRLPCLEWYIRLVRSNVGPCESAYAGYKALVRANAQYNLKAISNPQPYQDFFTSLSKSMFLDAHEVE